MPPEAHGTGTDAAAETERIHRQLVTGDLVGAWRAAGVDVSAVETEALQRPSAPPTLPVGVAEEARAAAAAFGQEQVSTLYGASMTLTVADMTAEVLENLKSELDKTHAALKKELSHVRTGRASTALLEGLHVDYYGTRTPLNQLASLSAPESSLLVIQPYDKSVMQAIEKAIQTSELGLNPQNDGKLIRLVLPTLTEERRKQLARTVGKVAEEGRVTIRNLRREANEKLKAMSKDKKVSEDDERRGHEQIQKTTDRFIAKVDELLKKKEQEILTI